MRGTPKRTLALGAVGAWGLALLLSVPVRAEIPGLTGTSFSLVATSGYVQGGDANNLYFWGFADGNPPGGPVQVQYPGPTLIVDQGTTVTVTLTNWLPEPVSLVFPGMEGVTATPTGIRGILTWEARPGGGTVTYTFTPTRPGTFYYQSGTNLDRQLEMGLFGAIIVRPTGFDAGDPLLRTAYGEASSRFTREYLFVHSEMDDRFHNEVELGQPVDTTTFFPTYWFFNGRNFPDTMSEADAPWLPAQPYNALPMMHPGDNVLIRIVNVGRDQHPFHTHSNHSLVIAWDGLPLSSDPANLAAVGADLGELAFSVMTVPGRTSDSIFTWTGKELGWDVYGDPALNGHTCVDGDGDGQDDTTFEWCADHGKPMPVTIPDQKDWEPGVFFGGSPFLGAKGPLPPGTGILNTDGSFFQIWHSHAEKELTTNDVFPGGMMTFMVIVHPSIPIP